MQLTMYDPRTSAVWAEALFVSVLQRSESPSSSRVRKAIVAAVRAHGSRGCAELVAQEFGDHPEAAAERMRWALAVAGKVFAPPPELARDRARGRPGLPVAGSPRRQLVKT